MWVSFLSIWIIMRVGLFFLELFREFYINFTRIVPNLLAQATIKYAKVIECCRLLGNR